MSSASFFISPLELWSRIGTADAPTILDVRRRDIYDAAPGLVPTASVGSRLPAHSAYATASG